MASLHLLRFIGWSTFHVVCTRTCVFRKSPFPITVLHIYRHTCFSHGRSNLPFRGTHSSLLSPCLSSHKRRLTGRCSRQRPSAWSRLPVTHPPQEPRLARGVRRTKDSTPRASHGSCLLPFPSSQPPLRALRLSSGVRRFRHLYHE
jgi:hypothetical protein